MNSVPTTYITKARLSTLHTSNKSSKVSGATAYHHLMLIDMAEDDTVSRSGGGQLSAFLLNHYIISKPLSPLINNIAAALLTVAYVRGVMEVGAQIRTKYRQPELSRKFIHLCACSFVIWWPLFDTSHWGWRLNVTVPAVMIMRLVWIGAIKKE